MTAAVAELTEAAPWRNEAPVEIRFEPISYDQPYESCDGHAAAEVRALVTVLLPSGGLIKLCGHHARVVGWEHTHTNTEENRTKGSHH